MKIFGKKTEHWINLIQFPNRNIKAYGTRDSSEIKNTKYQYVDKEGLSEKKVCD